MISAILRFFRQDDQGQDLSEYCLLTALVALLAIGLFLHASGGIGALWSTSNTSLASAGTAAGLDAAAGAATGATSGGEHHGDRGDH